MERSATQRAFEPLRKKYQGWKLPVLTSAEQAQQTQALETVREVLKHSVEGFLEEGSKLRLDLNTDVAKILSKLQGETGTLEDTRLAVQVVSDRLAEARNVRIAADALELATQEGEQRLQQIAENAQTSQDLFELECIEERAEWALQDQAALVLFEKAQATVAAVRSREEEKYTYTLKRVREVSEDARNERRTVLDRSMKEQDAVRTERLDVREAEIAAKEIEIPGLQEQVSQLQERLDSETRAAREASIAKTTRDLKNEAEVLTKMNEVALATKDREIESVQGHLTGQVSQIAELKKRIEEATVHHHRLSMQAMGGKDGE